jgi:hypothetical protein
MTMSKTRRPKARFKVGDWVTFLIGTRNAVVQIIEDRGPIGVKGRRLYRIERQFEDREPDRFEMPEEDLAAAEPPSEKTNLS